MNPNSGGLRPPLAIRCCQYKNSSSVSWRVRLFFPFCSILGERYPDRTDSVMVGQLSRTRTIALVLCCALLAGCSNLWHQGVAPPPPVASPPPSLPVEKATDGSKPQPATALLISGSASRPVESAPAPPSVQLPSAPTFVAQELPALAQRMLPEVPAKAELPAQPLQGPASVAALASWPSGRPSAMPAWIAT